MSRSHAFTPFPPTEYSSPEGDLEHTIAHSNPAGLSLRTPQLYPMAHPVEPLLLDLSGPGVYAVRGEHCFKPPEDDGGAAPRPLFATPWQ